MLVVKGLDFVQMVDYVLEKETKHLSKHFNGLRVDLNRCSKEEAIELPGPCNATLMNTGALCANLMLRIKETTTFTVRLDDLPEQSVVELLDKHIESRGVDCDSFHCANLSEDRSHDMPNANIILMLLLCNFKCFMFI